MRRFQQEFVLHSGIAARWWLRDLPNAALAERFLHRDLASGTVHLLAVDDIERTILTRLADDLGPFHLDPMIGGALSDDVRRLLTRLVEDGILVLVRQRILARQAFITAAHFNLPYTARSRWPRRRRSLRPSCSRSATLAILFELLQQSDQDCSCNLSARWWIHSAG